VPQAQTAALPWIEGDGATCEKLKVKVADLEGLAGLLQCSLQVWFIVFQVSSLVLEYFGTLKHVARVTLASILFGTLTRSKVNTKESAGIECTTWLFRQSTNFEAWNEKFADVIEKGCTCKLARKKGAKTVMKTTADRREQDDWERERERERVSWTNIGERTDEKGCNTLDVWIGRRWKWQKKGATERDERE
jgi:hypothetical protein